ncbi:gamma-glutamyl-gamma-aminobutyrate hydrolase family protein [Paenibacillus cremeus]|uniref:Gamma-glutamyl-gamma-aminobutyrate hydrolase family protein n=1 Tax=Paenibacillus cremeus TaxID=2163881 RepID=A0A559K030_9BACL|nr:gamma-glutamyl-gamma-aminobutyrate hydrolase family protein [Paenibacillus cremeus]TVY05410.1 gamma-glutamyl-gamma-aminobutyrate hydrolase family protein [Paenibacillus cremeus]
MRGTPVVGITGYHVLGEEGVGGKFRGLAGQGFSVIGHDYINAVSQAGGIPIGIPVGDPATARSIIKRLDGLVLAGGEDMDPTLYGAHPDGRCGTIRPERDLFELQLLGEALALNKPILAICRGMQLLNVFFGGTLYLDIADYSDQVLSHQFSRAPRWYLAHRVQLLSPLLQRLYQADEIRTNSYHHQAVHELGEGLQVAAVAEDGIVEGLLHPDHPQLLAVQWHPEMLSVKHEEGLIPFHWLLEQIRSEGGCSA